jgi:hypothetical protein
MRRAAATFSVMLALVVLLNGCASLEQGCKAGKTGDCIANGALEVIGVVLIVATIVGVVVLVAYSARSAQSPETYDCYSNGYYNVICYRRY